jgi:hypothetical protein
VELAHAAQNGYTIDQYHPDEENYDPEGHRDEVVEARLGAVFFNERGLPSTVRAPSWRFVGWTRSRGAEYPRATGP